MAQSKLRIHVLRVHKTPKVLLYYNMLSQMSAFKTLGLLAFKCHI